MKPVLSLLLVGLAVPSQAQTPPTPAAPARRAPSPTRIPGVSEAGNAILAKQQTAADPQLSALLRQQRALGDQLVSAAMAPMIDIDKVEGLLRQQEEIQAQIRTRNNDRRIVALKLLPEEDRGPFMRAVVTPTTGAPPR